MVTEKIFQQAKDKNVAAIVIYVGASGDDMIACKDAAGATPFTTSELKDAFFKGSVVNFDTDSYAVPVTYIKSNGFGSISIYDGTQYQTIKSVADPS